MNCVGVVPEDPEVITGDLGDFRELLNDFFRVGVARRVGIFGNTPDTFNSGIL